MADHSHRHGGGALIAYLRRSLLVYLWAVASVAWLIHAGQHLARHGDVLFAMDLADAAAVLGRTIVDIARPIGVGAVLLIPLLVIGFWCSRPGRRR